MTATKETDMTEVNVMLSIERKTEREAEMMGYNERGLESSCAYKLGYTESMLTNVLHQVYSRFGEDVMVDMMERIGVTPVYRG
jgi:hypothetical protein